jgi:hypothetical protein
MREQCDVFEKYLRIDSPARRFVFCPGDVIQRRWYLQLYLHLSVAKP